MSHPHFVHLNVHTEYSIVDSTVRIPQLIKSVKDMGMPAVAITDVNNLFATIKFFKAAKNAGIKPIVGADVLVQNEDLPDKTWEMTLLCQDEAGYKNLSILLSKAQKHVIGRGTPCVTTEMIKAHNSGLIALADSVASDVGYWIQSKKLEQAVDCLVDWKSTFGDRYYLAVAQINRPNEKQINAAAMYMAAHQNIPMVASGRVRFMASEDYSAHEARICINRGDVLADPKRDKDFTDSQYLRNPEEMSQLYSKFPVLLENSYEIAKRCNIDFNFKDYFLPDFPVPDGLTIDEYFAKLCDELLTNHLATFGVAEGYTEADYFERLHHEVKVILGMGFPGYFLIVSDFIRWSKDNDIPVGPGRGSGAGSLVAYVLKITNLDPLKYELLFERFLNPERISMPDFDVDFCMDRRDEVIAYVGEKYGKEKVSQIITYGSMTAKAVIRDSGRVLGYPYPVVDGIAKVIPNELGITLTEALDSPEMAELNRTDDEANEVISLGLKLEGLKRNVGKHAGGVVIAPSAIADFCPIYIEQQSQSVVSQFDKDDVETIGLVKFDFLGLKTLTIIDWAIKSIENQTGEKIDIDLIPLDDEPTFELLRAAKTTSVFQLESAGMQALITRLKPDCFEDIIALVALFRPGPLDSGMVDTYVKCKHGQEQPDYMHDSLEEILKPTYGVILYQEQVMQIAQVLSNYTLGGADILRKAMGKKIAEVMEQQKQIFIDGAVENDVDGELAAKIFKNIETFAGYGFNKSHSAAYALVSYQTAYLKTHYPAHFMAAVLSADMDSTDKIVNQIQDINNFGIEVKMPDVNHSVYRFKARDGAIQYGLGAIKGVGEGAIEDIVFQREQSGPYKSFQDLCNRVNLRKCNKRTLVALINGGAFDHLHNNRNQLLQGMEQVVKAADQQSKDRDAGQFDLFGGMADNSYQSISLPEVEEMPLLEKLLAEKAVLGSFMSDHPIRPARSYLANQCSYEMKRMVEMNKLMESGGDFRMLGMITGIRPGFNDKMKMMLSDASGSYEFTLTAKQFEEYQELLNTYDIVMIEGAAGKRTFKGKEGEDDKEYFACTISSMIDLNSAIAMYCDRLCFVSEKNSEQLVKDIDDLLSEFGRGKAQIYVHYIGSKQKINLQLSEDHRIRPSYELIEKALEKASIQDVLTH
ncbi:DNA polymerase III subunit alpha [Marinicella rhabdoformis]|uniref:DNA polymerase III subunit alpha n=1 Tax=Marinicella rhabdoformis TaxID=2580566 RepID=UPI0012AEC893|nr:DNA polymerase III subunit alpha [Marinicella rhabdoformis]